MRPLITSITMVWLTLISLFSVWNIYSTRKSNADLAKMTAKSIFDEITLARTWNASHGGVYVPVTEVTQPNEYLEDPMREIVVSPALTLTKINPAYMTRQISELESTKTGIYFHITSLDPIRPLNKPTDLERKALESFEGGSLEYFTYLKGDGKKSFFYMAPLITDESCLACHAKQGYKSGDIRGGISITLPLPLDTRIPTMIVLFCVLGVAGCGGIYIFSKKLRDAYGVIERQAVTDSLTQIPNRRLFESTLQQEILRRRRDHHSFSLLILDIDFFKQYNDTYGHQAGDRALVRVAEEIRNHTKRGGDFCARYGGEEFVIILPSTGRTGAFEFAERLRGDIEKLESDDLPGKVTISLGIAVQERAMGPDEDPTSLAESMLKRADDAMYQAKGSGRNCSRVAEE